MDNYKLIHLDQMEASIVRRRLLGRSKADQEVATALVHALQGKQCLSNIHITEPWYVTNVYPLYFYWAHDQHLKHREVYDRVFQLLPTDNFTMPKAELRPHVWRVADTEIDILVEDVEYFVFIEAKEPKPGHKVKFQNQGGVHQLVRQYVQGRILEKRISKTFALATIGANNGQMLEIKLNPTERALLQLIEEEKEVLQVIDLSWPSFIEVAQGGE